MAATQMLTALEVEERFFEAARQNEDEARQRFGCPPGRFQTSARQHGALWTAIRWIGDARTVTDGFTRLFEKYRETGDDRARQLTLEHLFISFAEMYGEWFPDLFPTQTVSAARAKLNWS
jgi:hypothetical protein